MREGKIDSTQDFTPSGLGELKSWLEPWFLEGHIGSLPARQIQERIDQLEARITVLERGVDSNRG